MGAFYGGKGNSLAAAIVFILLDAAWVAVPVLGLFAVMKRTCGVRSDFGGRTSDSELDSSKHGDVLLPTSVKMPGSRLRRAAGAGGVGRLHPRRPRARGRHLRGQVLTTRPPPPATGGIII